MKEPTVVTITETFDGFLTMLYLSCLKGADAFDPLPKETRVKFFEAIYPLHKKHVELELERFKKLKERHNMPSEIMEIIEKKAHEATIGEGNKLMLVQLNLELTDLSKDMQENLRHEFASGR